jgi:hypothetical protein
MPCCGESRGRSRRANIWKVVGTESLTFTQQGAEPEKLPWNDVDYAVKSRMAQHRSVLRWLMQFWLANSLPSSTISPLLFPSRLFSKNKG